MALIRTKPASPLDAMPTFYDPAQMMSPQPTQTPQWNVATNTQPTPYEGTWENKPVPGQPSPDWPTSPPMPGQPPQTPMASGMSFEDLLGGYWDPDRREKLLAELEKNYHAPDKAQRIDYFKNLSDAELWQGRPGGATTPTPTPPTPVWQQPPSMPAPPGFDQGKWGNIDWGTDKYKAGRILAAGGSIDDVLKELGNGWRKVNADSVMAPDGSVFDLYFDYGGPQQRVQWTYVGGGPSAGMGPPPAPPTAPGAAPTASAMPPAPTAPTAPAGPTVTGAQSPVAAAAPAPDTPWDERQGFAPPWQAGNAHAWQQDLKAQGVYQQVGVALARATGKTPTPEEVWAQLNYAQMPDQNFVRTIIGNIAQMTPPAAPAAPTQAPQEDPYVAEYQKYLDAYLRELEAQRGRKTSENEQWRARQQQAQASTDRLLQFLEERAKQLQGPAYTGAEGEVFRTQALDPIENDRTAAKQRAMQRISARGIDPNSGIAQQLLNEVDSAFDKTRAGTQNELAYNQITEQRSRQQEAQQLLGMVPMIQRAALEGDVNFLDMLDQQIRGTYTAGMPAAQSKYNIPNDALQSALAALGVGPDPMQLLQMLMQQQNYQQANSNAMWGSLGSMLPYYLSLLNKSGGTMPTGWSGGT